MLEILLATPQQDRFQVLQSELTHLHPTHFLHAPDGRAALEQVRNATVDLVIVDEDLGDMSGLELVRELLGVNALINTVLVYLLTLALLFSLSPSLTAMQNFCSNPDNGSLFSGEFPGSPRRGRNRVAFDSFVICGII